MTGETASNHQAALAVEVVNFLESSISADMEEAKSL